jgi:uncharacterized protein YbjT (DUF2867 family)
MSQNYLILGATGTVGSEIVKLLKAQGLSVRTTTSKPATAPDSVHVNLSTGEGLDAALAGIDRAFFLSPGGYADQYALLAPLIAKAKEADLKKVVLMTAIGAEQAKGTPLYRVEQDLKNSGLPYNIVRPSWFMQNFTHYYGYGIKELNSIALPTGDGKAGFIDARDIAAVCATLLTDDTHNNQGFNITGSEALDHHQVAALISEATGKQVAYQDITPEAFKAVLLGAGANEPYADMMVTLMSYLKAGYTAKVTDEVQKVTGHAPRTFKAFAQDFKSAWV